MYCTKNLATVGMLSTLLACFTTSVNAIELAVNGGLETGDFTGWTQFEVVPGDQTISSTNPSSGTYSLNIDNQTLATNSLVKQANLAAGQLTPGQSITVSFDARGSVGVGGVAFAQIFSELDGGGVSLAEFVTGGPLPLNPDPNVWTNFSVTTNLGPDVSGGVTLQLEAVTGGAPGSFATMWYDNISITVDSLLPPPEVPEPTSIVLVGMAGLSIVGCRRQG